MRKIFFTILFVCACLVANAQGKFTTPVEEPQTQNEKPRRGLFDRDKTPIDKKYLAGACPEVEGKIVWQKYFDAGDMTAKEIYDVMLGFLQKMSKGEKQTEKSPTGAWSGI